MHADILNAEFNAYVANKALSIPYTLTCDQYQSFDQMVAEFELTGRIRINTGFSEGTIFGIPEVNWMFRAWHDYCHLLTGGNFTLWGESLACLEQLAQIHSDASLTDEQRETFSQLVTIEVIGQANYYFETGTFPVDQMEFTARALECGKYRDYLKAIQTAITAGADLIC